MKKILGIMFALVLLSGMGMVTATPLLAATAPPAIRVPNDYATIQEAVDAASDGDTIAVAAGKYGAFIVEGKRDISIIGAEGASVTSTNLYTALPIVGKAWVMAVVYNSQNIRIEGVSFDGAGLSGKAVFVGIAYVDSTGSITHLSVENVVATDLGAGVAVIGDRIPSRVEITDATISSNKKAGIYVCGGSALEAHFNKIMGNSECGLFNDGGGAADATYNWWGHASGPLHETNLLGKGNAVVGDVSFKPWLGAAPAIVKTQTVVDGTVDAKEEADTEVVVINGTATVTISKLVVKGTATVAAAEHASDLRLTTAHDLVRQADAGPLDVLELEKFAQLDIFRDVRVVHATPGTEVEIRLYYTDDEIRGFAETTLRLFWFNGNVFVPCSPDSASGVNTASTEGYSGYMWARITATTRPSLADLEGTPFGGYGHPSEAPQPCCFIATAAFDTNTAKQLYIVRQFRDEILLPNSLGAKLASFYYRISPPIASFISRHEVARTAMRVGFVEPTVVVLTWSYHLWSARGSH